jgi:tetratricopeptide (TPR) repeat protein
MIWLLNPLFKEGTMRRTIVMLVVSAAVIAGLQLASAEEGLFDTKAAAEHVDKGIAHLKEKKYDAAVAELEEAVSINPDAEAYYYLGYAYYMKGRKGDAESRKKSIECFDKAYELNPSFSPGRFKPAEAGEITHKPKPPKGPQPAVPAPPSEPAGPAAPEQTDRQTSGQDNPSQPTPPVKATDKAKDIGDAPLGPN